MNAPTLERECASLSWIGALSPIARGLEVVETGAPTEREEVRAFASPLRCSLRNGILYRSAPRSSGDPRRLSQLPYFSHELDHDEIEQRFIDYLKRENQKMTPQRRRVFEKAFEVHEHFSVEQMYEWLKEEEGPAVSRATVYRTLDVLQRGGFIEAVEAGPDRVVYEHVLGHKHHDHLVCQVCGRIEEFQDDEIEALQRKNAYKLGFVMTGHMLRLSGICPACVKELQADGTFEERLRSLGG